MASLISHWEATICTAETSWHQYLMEFYEEICTNLWEKQHFNANYACQQQIWNDRVVACKSFEMPADGWLQEISDKGFSWLLKVICDSLVLVMVIRVLQVVGSGGRGWMGVDVDCSVEKQKAWSIISKKQKVTLLVLVGIWSWFTIA